MQSLAVHPSINEFAEPAKTEPELETDENIFDNRGHSEENVKSVHLAPRQEEPENILKQITEHFMVKNFIPEAANFLSIFGNAASAIANIFNLSDSAKSFADGFGKFGTKAFLILNGAINVLEYLLKFDLLGALGHLNDVIIGSTVQHDHIYLDRGSASGTYTLANSLSIINGNDSFKSPGHHFSQSLTALKKTFHNFVSKDFLKNLADSNNAMLGVIAGILSNFGTLTWLATGKEKLATIIRDFVMSLL